MDPMQKAAFIIAQAALVNAKVAGMVAENQKEASNGRSPRYTMTDFEEASQDGVIGWNAVISFFQD